MSRKYERSEKQEQSYHHSRKESLSKYPPKSQKDYSSYASDLDQSSHHSQIPFKGIRRSNKINNLQQQFQDLKKKIKEVENKNEKIIEKINSGKDVKKGSDNFLYIEGDYGPAHTEIIPAYFKNKLAYQPMSVKGKQHHTLNDYSISEFKSQGALKAKDIYNPLKIPEINSNNFIQQDGLTNKLKIDIIALEDKYSKQQSKFEHVKSNFYNYSSCVTLIIENQLNIFMQHILTIMQRLQTKEKKNKQKILKLQDKVKGIRVKSKRRQNRFSNSFDGMRRRDKSQSGLQTNKTKQFQNLISKYENILRNKNEEIEKLNVDIKVKERQVYHINDKLSELKQDKRKMGHQYDETISKLQLKIQSLNQSKAETKRKDMSLTIQKQDEKSKQKHQRQIQKYVKQVKSLQSKLNFTQSRLDEKVRTIEQFQLQMRGIESNKMDLIKQYQESFERTRATNKVKYEEMMETIEILKGNIKDKEGIISIQGNQYKRLENNMMELKVELIDVKQKLLLKEDMDRLDKSVMRSRGDLEQLIPETSVSMIFNDHNAGLVQILEKEKRGLQMNYDKIKGQFEIFKLTTKKSQQSLFQKDSIIRSLNSKIKSLQSLPQKANIPQQPSQTSHILQFQLQQLSKQNIQLKASLEQLKKQNITLNSTLISQTHDISLTSQFYQQEQQRTKQLKHYIEELEQMLQTVQNSQKLKAKQSTSQSQKLQTEIQTLNNKLKTKQHQLQSLNHQYIKQNDKTNIKVLQVKKLQQQIQDLKLQIVKTNLQKKGLQMQFFDFQQDAKKQNIIDQRINQQYKQDILKLKEQMQKLFGDNTALVEINKHQKVKIDELQLQFYANDESHSEIFEDSKSSSLLQKVRHLESASLQSNIIRLNLQRHLKNSQQNNTKLMQQVNSLLLELERKKSQFSTTIIVYDQRIHEMEQMLEAAQRALKQKSHLKISISNIQHEKSLIFSNSIQKFEFEEEEGQQINVENIFNMGYPENIKLKRKDQVEFIKNTAQLINKLKTTINQKNRKIKGLQKRNGDNSDVWGIGKNEEAEQVYDIEDFHQNYSVRFDDRKEFKNRKMRQLENETHLVMEENRLLLQQVNNLQEELTRSEEQENNLVRLKDILKEQVKKLQRGNDEQQLRYQEEIKRLNLMIKEGEETHNLETMRILIPKVYGIVMDEEGLKREDRKRQLEEYLKIIAGVLRIEVPVGRGFRR